MKHPKIKVKLVGRDGNAWAILGNVVAAMKKGGLSAEEIKEFQTEAMSRDYDNLLRTCMEWVNVS
jgi:hypothetical protein